MKPLLGDLRFPHRFPHLFCRLDQKPLVLVAVSGEALMVSHRISTKAAVDLFMSRRFSGCDTGSRLGLPRKVFSGNLAPGILGLGPRASCISESKHYLRQFYGARWSLNYSSDDIA